MYLANYKNPSLTKVHVQYNGKGRWPTKSLMNGKGEGGERELL
jgi:hypothetical protein